MTGWPARRMEHLVIKPSLACTANCRTCSSRRLLHKELKRQRQLSFPDWQKALSEARNLGVWHLTISGGEPTLYPRLAEIIRIGRSYGWLVRLNSNGGFARKNYGAELVEAGLNVVDISLYGSTPSLHDRMRGSEGLWRNATGNIRIFADLRKHYPGFQVMTQTILCRENYRDFGELLKLHRELGSSGLLVSYLEGDFAGDSLLSAGEIEEFRSDILPKAVEACRSLDRYTRELAISAVSRIFSPEVLDAEMWARGTYHPGNFRCGIPRKQALVLANGDVHPCNMVEYTHDSVMGNLFSNSLKEVWGSQAWEEFRRRRHPQCPLCPMSRHLYVPLQPATRVRGMVKAGLHKLHLDRLEEMLYPAIRKARVMAARTLDKKR